MTDRVKTQLALANEKIREFEAELAQRNNGECFGPFHGGFICADCARLTRDLQARAEKAEKERDETRRRLENEHDEVARLQARIAELEEEIVRWQKGSGIFTFSESRED